MSSRDLETARSTQAENTSAENIRRSESFWKRLIGRIDLPTLVLAIALTGAQVMVATLCGSGETWQERYRSLCTWDGGWYQDIVVHGYRTEIPPGAGQQYNVAFFPGYPIAATIVQRLTRLSPAVALLLTAQVGAVVFWWAVLKMLKRWLVAPAISSAAIMLIFSQPGAFYLVVSYAESLFMASFLLLLYFGVRANASTIALTGAALAGYVASATRIVGAPLATIPAIWALGQSFAQHHGGASFARISKGISRHALVSVATSLGAITFFIYCWRRFGHWDEYMRARAVGWSGAHADYSVLWMPENFRIFFPTFDSGFISHSQVSHLYFPVLTFLLVAVPLADAWLSRQKRITGFYERAAFYLGAAILFFCSASGGANLGGGSYVGFIRYAIYSYVPLIMAFAHASRSFRAGVADLPLRALLIVFIVSAVSLALQFHFCWQYARGVVLIA